MREKLSSYGYLREMGSFFLLTLFEILFVGISLWQSKGMAFQKVYLKTETGALYYHTEQIAIWSKLLIFMLVFWVIQYLLMRFAYEHNLSFAKILCPVFVLSTIGVVFQTYVGTGTTKHYITILVGLLVMIVFLVLGTLTLSENSCKWACWGMIALAMINLIYGLMNQKNGAGPWIEIFGVSIQPGEFYKIFVVMFAAYAFIHIRDNLKIRKLFILTFVVWVAVLMAVGDFGNALILILVCMLTVLPLYSKWIAIAGVADVVLALYVMVALSDSFKDFLGENYLVSRFSSVFSAFDSPEKFQYRQVLYGALRGGANGTGLADGVYTYATQAYAAYSDYSFLTITSIWGIAAALLIIGAMVAIVLNSSVAMGEHWELSHFSIGKIASTTLCMQMLLHVAGTLNIFPHTGVTFPWLSAGGSSMICSYAIVGIILSSQLSCKHVQKVRTKLYSMKKCWFLRGVKE